MKGRTNTVDLTVRSIEDVEQLLERVRRSAALAHDWIAAQSGDPLDMLRRMKFDQIGFHPIEGYALNLVEQINQTWTFAVAVAAARQLLELHPEAGGFHLAPGAHAAQPLDIMSIAEGLVGAETCAVVHPRNNKKLDNDLLKLAARPETYRYVFMMCPLFPTTERLSRFERDGVQVWSIDL